MVSSMKRKIASDYSNSARTQLDEIAERFETSFAKLEQIADDICTNSDVKELLYVKDSEEKKGMYQALYSGTSSGRGMGAFLCDRHIPFASSGTSWKRGCHFKHLYASRRVLAQGLTGS